MTWADRVGDDGLLEPVRNADAVGIAAAALGLVLGAAVAAVVLWRAVRWSR